MYSHIYLLFLFFYVLDIFGSKNFHSLYNKYFRKIDSEGKHVKRFETPKPSHLSHQTRTATLKEKPLEHLSHRICRILVIWIVIVMTISKAKQTYICILVWNGYLVFSFNLKKFLSVPLLLGVCIYVNTPLINLN